MSGASYLILGLPTPSKTPQLRLGEPVLLNPWRKLSPQPLHGTDSGVLCPHAEPGYWRSRSQVLGTRRTQEGGEQRHTRAGTRVSPERSVPPAASGQTPGPASPARAELPGPTPSRRCASLPRSPHAAITWRLRPAARPPRFTAARQCRAVPGRRRSPSGGGGAAAPALAPAPAPACGGCWHDA